MNDDALPDRGSFVTVVTAGGAVGARVAEAHGGKVMLNVHSELPGLRTTGPTTGQVHWTSERGLHVLEVELHPAADHTGRRRPDFLTGVALRRADIQRRRYTRAAGVGRAMVVDEEGRHSELAPTLNLSEGGALLRGGGWLTRGDEVVVRLLVGTSMFALPAVVRRVDTYGVAGEAAVAVEFVAPVTGADTIRRAVLTAQVEARRVAPTRRRSS